MPRLACLSSLDLSGNDVAKPACWAERVKGEWPNLTHLDLSRNHLDTSFFGQLKNAKWPLLGSLNLHSALYQVSATAQAQHEALQGIVQCDWHHLQSLGLASCGLNPEAMQTICQAQCGIWLGSPPQDHLACGLSDCLSSAVQFPVFQNLVYELTAGQVGSGFAWKIYICCAAATPVSGTRVASGLHPERRKGYFLFASGHSLKH